MKLRTPSSILLAVCLVNCACLLATSADEINPDGRQKLSDGPIEFAVEHHKTEQKLVFKLALPAVAPPDMVRNAAKNVVDTFHQWGAAIETACHNLDHVLKAYAYDGSAKALSPPPKHLGDRSAAGQNGPKPYWPTAGRAKSIAQR